ncbi:MAG: nuclease SbcCD subunit [Chloroflexi bacterium]|nr:nuclease SbcCD subunit [Chloroflexota bacterium]
MRITRLALRSLRMHRDLDLELAPGLTVVQGPNESGKTTLQRAIELALFRRVTSADAELTSLRSWGSADDSRPWVRLDFVQEDEDGVRTGSLEKDFRGAKGTVRLEYDGQVLTDPAAVDDLMADLTGIPGEKFFRSTASIRHHEVNDLARDEGALRDRLQASISGADRGTSVVKRQLERALHDLEAQGAKNPGRLKIAEEAVARTETVVAGGEAQLAALERDRDALVVARERRAEADATLEERRALLERARQAERLAAEREVARERFERYRQAVVVSEQIQALEASHPSPDALPVLRQIVERLRGLDRDVSTLRAQLSEEPSSVEYDIRIPEPRYRPFAWLSLVLAIGGVVAAGLGVLSGQLAIAFGGAAAAVVALLLAWYARTRRRAAFDLRRQKQLRDDEIARRLRGRSSLEDELRRKEADMKAQLASIDLPDLPAAEDLLAREDAHVQEIGRARAQLDGLVGKEPVETLGQVRDAAALEIEQKTAALEMLGPIAREPRARERLEVEVRDCEGALERARDDEATARARVEQNPVDADQVALEAERLAAWREQLAALRRRARIYRLTHEAIDRAELATMRRATRYLEKRMRGDLERLTDGRYRRVEVDDSTLAVSIWSPDRGDWIPAESLSQGTLDQVYLAARLGLVRLVTRDRRPPLVLDDPFVTFDDGRAARAFDVLRSLTSDLQVIYLTTTDRYDALADRVLVLPAPQLRDSGPAGDEVEDDLAGVSVASRAEGPVPAADTTQPG